MVEAVTVQNVSKHFGPTVALDDVSISFEAGMVHGLIGENGAGKSTLVKILAGLLKPDSGNIKVYGSIVSTGSPHVARAAGVATVFQELMLVPYTTAARNLLLGSEPRNALGFVSEKVLNRVAEEKLQSVGITDIPVDSPIQTLPLSARQKLNIASALIKKSRVLILDEATSALGPADVDWLFETVHRLVDAGTTVLVITHRLMEIRRVCDRITILRDGRSIGTFDRDRVSDEEIVQRMVGRSLEAVAHSIRGAPTDREPLLEARDLSGHGFEDVSFKIYPGEIVGLAALKGHGQRELFMALFGDHPITDGEMLVNGRAVRMGSPTDAIKAGLALIPEERKTEGLFLELTGRENVSLPSLKQFARLGVINRAAESARVRTLLKRLTVDAKALQWSVASFSGGNQQKILFAKWLMTDAKVLLLYDPTRGVDIGAKHETYLMMQELARAGAALFFYTTEVEELLQLPDRVLTMYAGHLRDEFRSEEIAPEALLRSMMGFSGQAGRQPDEKGGPLREVSNR